MTQRGFPADRWCELLGTVKLAINSIAQDSTGISPCILVFGQELSLPIDFMVGTTGNILAAQDFAQQQGELIDAVCASLQKLREHQTMFANYYRWEEEFAVDDWALLDASKLSIPGICKFRQQFIGPFVITACFGEVAYHLDLKGGFTRIHPVFHVSLLHRFVAGRDGIEPPEPIEVEDTQEYMVEGLLAHQHGCQGDQQYLVRWEGYNASEDIWISETNLSGAQRILRMYKRAYQLT